MSPFEAQPFLETGRFVVHTWHRDGLATFRLDERIFRCRCARVRQ
jgi:hypothetical protein